MRRGRERPLSGAINRLVDSLAPTDPVARVAGAWPSLVGEAMAKHTKPVALKGGELKIECASSVYAQELELLSRKVIKALTERIPEAPVTSLRCVVAKR
jgi:predicted nucleic acid-binding Zn ribbon protein